MFERLIKSFGHPANQHHHAVYGDGEVQLSTALILYSVLPVDYRITVEEGRALAQSLVKLFGFSTVKCHRFMARAAAAYNRDSSIMAAATLLKKHTTPTFRSRILVEVTAIIQADGVFHGNEADLRMRIENLLGLSQPTYATSELAQSA